MFSDVSVIACKAATAVHDKMKLLSSDMIMGKPEQDNYLSKYLQERFTESCYRPTTHQLNVLAEDGGERSEQFQEYLSSLSIPAPWAAGRTVESVHPVRDNYKFKDTVTIPGARSLYLRFDPRCATQYDYDKVGEVNNISII